MNTVLNTDDNILCQVVFEEAMILKKLLTLFQQINPETLPLKFSRKTLEGYVTYETSKVKKSKKPCTISGSFVLNIIDLPYYINKFEKEHTCILRTDQIVSALASVKKRNYLSLYEKKDDPNFYYNLNGISSILNPIIGVNLENFTPPHFTISEEDPIGRMPISAFHDYCTQCKNYGKDGFGAMKIEIYQQGLIFKALSYGEEGRNSSRSCGVIHEDKYIKNIYININSILVFINTITVIAPIASVIKFYVEKTDSLGILKLMFPIGGFGTVRIYIEGIEYQEKS